MRNKLWFALIASLGGIAYIGFADKAFAEPVMFEFTAVVDTAAAQPASLETELPQIGSTLSGYYTFDSDAPDQNPGTTAGFYECSAVPCAFYIQLQDSRIFQTDSSQVDFDIIINDSPNGVPGDSYTARSNQNIFPFTPELQPFHTQLYVNLLETDHISNDLLPLTPPQVTLPSDDNKIFIVGNAFDPTPPFEDVTYFVSARLNSLTLKATVGSSLNALKNLVAGLNVDSFKGENMQNALGNKIDAALAQLALIEAETDPDLKAMLIDDLRDKMTNDILAKSNGCPSTPDNNDWITDCASQTSVQALIQQILDLLDALS